MKILGGKVSGNCEKKKKQSNLHELLKYLTEAMTFINITAAV